MPKFFRFPWASTGDKTTIPDETDVAGFVSYQQGYGNDYARDPASDPLAKLIERDKMNQLFSDLTENAQYWQTHAFPEYITAAQNGGVDYAYDELAIVRYDSGTGYKVYQNTVAGNTNLPTGAGWVEYKIEAIINAAAAKATPVDADELALVDSAASNALKKLTWANLKATLKTYFDTLYPSISNNPAFIATTSASQSFTANVVTKLACDTEQLDNTSAYDAVTNYRFTPQKAGWYKVHIQMQSTFGNYGASITLYKNGVTHERLQSTLANTIIDTISGGSMVYLNGTTDYIEAYGSWTSNNTAVSVFNANYIVGV